MFIEMGPYESHQSVLLAIRSLRFLNPFSALLPRSINITLTKKKSEEYNNQK